MPNINCIVVDGTTLVDLSADTVVSGSLKTGISAKDKSGAEITGTNSFSSAGSDPAEHVTFTSSTSSIILDGAIYVTKTDGMIVANTMPGMKAPRSDTASCAIGTLPSSWGASFSPGGGMSSYCFNKAHVMEIGTGGTFYCLSTSSGTLTVPASTFAIFSPTASSEIMFPASLDTWKWTTSDNTQGHLSSSTSISVKKIGNLAFFDGEIYFSSDQNESSSWLTVASIPDGYRPGIDVGAPCFYWRTDKGTVKGEGGIYADGSLKIKTLAKATGWTGAVTDYGTEANQRISVKCVYPIDFGTEVT